jgi:hypothetical protein
MTWRIVALALYGVAALIVVPVGVLVAIGLTFKPLYVVDTATLADFETAGAPRAFPSGYVSLEPVRGGLAIGPGWTARYPDGSTLAIVESDEAGAAVTTYGDSLDPQWSTQATFGSEVRRDLGFSDGRVMRLLAEGPYLFALAAPSAARLSQLAARIHVVDRNTEHGWGNDVTTHWRRAGAIALLWFCGNFALLGLAVWRIVVAARASRTQRTG